jgi:hypothetical protein
MARAWDRPQEPAAKAPSPSCFIPLFLSQRHETVTGMYGPENKKQKTFFLFNFLKRKIRKEFFSRRFDSRRRSRRAPASSVVTR